MNYNIVPEENSPDLDRKKKQWEEAFFSPWYGVLSIILSVWKEKKNILYFIHHYYSSGFCFQLFCFLHSFSAFFYSVLVRRHEGREVHTFLILSKIKDKESYRKNNSTNKQTDNNYFLCCQLSVWNDQKPCFVSFPKCWYKSMKEDTKNHIIDVSLGITSTHTEAMVKLPIEKKKYKKQKRMEWKKSEKCRDKYGQMYSFYGERIIWNTH